MGALQSAKLHPSFVAASTLKQIQQRNLTGNEMASDSITSNRPQLPGRLVHYYFFF